MKEEGAAFKQYKPYRGDAKKRTLGDNNEELVAREKWKNWLLDFFREAVSDILGYALDKHRPDVLKHLADTQDSIQCVLADSNPAYRDIAHVYHALVLVEWHILQMSEMTRDNLEYLTRQLELRVLNQKAGGPIRILGRPYELVERLTDVDGADKLLEHLGQLDAMVRRNEHEREGREIMKLRTSPTGTSGDLLYPLLSLEDFLTREDSIEARCEMQLARETHKNGPVHQSGTLFLKSNTKGDVCIEQVFYGVAGYVRRNGLLGVPIPRSVLANRRGFSAPARGLHPRRRGVWNKIYALVERGFRTVESDKLNDFDKSRNPRRTTRGRSDRTRSGARQTASA